jgi:hypothetical protein
MNDRELLELAAKAVELPECGWMGPAFMYVKDNTFTDWNPLDDDGDALRLAVKLKLDVLHGAEMVAVETERPKEVGCVELYKEDPYAATRRAIVRAAAAIRARGAEELRGETK